jgi:hypothetical protein
MMTFTLMTVGLVTLAAAMAAVCVMMTQTPVAESAVASPFSAGSRNDPSADTLEGGTAYRVFPLAQPGEWQIATCDSLAEVEDMLDSLENHGVTHREMLTLSNSCFAVRWKC